MSSCNILQVHCGTMICFFMESMRRRVGKAQRRSQQPENSKTTLPGRRLSFDQYWDWANGNFLARINRSIGPADLLKCHCPEGRRIPLASHFLRPNQHTTPGTSFNPARPYFQGTACTSGEPAAQQPIEYFIVRDAHSSWAVSRRSSQPHCRMRRLPIPIEPVHSLNTAARRKNQRTRYITGSLLVIKNILPAAFRRL